MTAIGESGHSDRGPENSEPVSDFADRIAVNGFAPDSSEDEQGESAGEEVASGHGRLR